MYLEELVSYIYIGIGVLDSHIKEFKEDDDVYYLTLSDLKENSFSEINHSKYLSNRILKKFYTSTTHLEYGDYLLYRKEEKFYLLRFDNQVSRKVIVSDDFFILRGANSYLTNVFRDSSGRQYFYEQLNESYKLHKNNIDKFYSNLKKTEISIRKLDVSTEIKDYKEYERKGLNPNDINFTEGKISIYSIIEKIKAGVIDLFTDFQRSSNLWTISDQSRLIESFLIKFPVPSFYFDSSSNDTWLVIDGLQRLSTLKNFIIDKNFKLTKLEYLKELEGKYYHELPAPDQLALLDYNVSIFNFKEGTPVRVKYSLFERINTAGLVLNSQEIRHALNQGDPDDPSNNPAKYLATLSKVGIFKEIWGSMSKERMQDRESILRYVAFRITHYSDYKPDMKEFLDESMTKLYSTTPERLDDIEFGFKKALLLTRTLFGKNERYFTAKTSSGSELFRNSLFDTFLYNFSILPEEKRKTLEERKLIFREKYSQLIHNELFLENITDKANTKEGVDYRFEKVKELIDSITKL